MLKIRTQSLQGHGQARAGSPNGNLVTSDETRVYLYQGSKWKRTSEGNKGNRYLYFRISGTVVGSFR